MTGLAAGAGSVEPSIGSKSDGTAPNPYRSLPGIGPGLEPVHAERGVCVSATNPGQVISDLPFFRPVEDVQMLSRQDIHPEV